MNPRFYHVIGSLVALALSGAALGGCGETQSPAGAMMAPHEMPVKLTKVSQALIEESSEYAAQLKSRKSITICPQISGHLTKLFVEAGNVVRQNQTLLEIDPNYQIASVDGFEEAVRTNRADLDTAESTLRSLEASRVGKISNLHYAKVQQDRYKILQSQGVIARQDLDQWINQAESAQADLDNVEAQIKAQQSTVRKIQRAIAQAEATLRSQRVQLGYYTLRAPFPGTVGDIPVKLGDYVTPVTKLTTITQNNPLEAYIAIPTERASDLKNGMTVRLFNSGEKQMAIGKVFFIAPNVDESSQSVMVKAAIPNDQGLMRADQIVHAKVVWKTEQGLLVPTDAVSHSGGQDYVFVAQNGSANKLTARQTPVKLGDIENNKYQVLEGLKPGEEVVTSGVQNLMDGVPIVAAQ